MICSFRRALLLGAQAERARASASAAFLASSDSRLSRSAGAFACADPPRRRVRARPPPPRPPPGHPPVRPRLFQARALRLERLELRARGGGRPAPGPRGPRAPRALRTGSRAAPPPPAPATEPSPRRRRPPWRPRSATAPRAPSRQVGARARDVPGLTASARRCRRRARAAHPPPPRARAPPAPSRTSPPPPPRERRRRSDARSSPPPASSRGRAPGNNQSPQPARAGARAAEPPPSEDVGAEPGRARTGGAHARDAAGDGEPACVWKRVGSACLRAISSCVRVAAGDGGRRVRRACADPEDTPDPKAVNVRNVPSREPSRGGTRESGGNTGPRREPSYPRRAPSRDVASWAGSALVARRPRVRKAMTSSVFDDTTKTPLSVVVAFLVDRPIPRARDGLARTRPRSRIASRKPW